MTRVIKVRPGGQSFRDKSKCKVPVVGMGFEFEGLYRRPRDIDVE